MKSESWITEWNILFVTPGLSVLDTVGSANRSLHEWGYDFHFTVEGFLNYLKVRWIDPEVFYDEQWPREGISHKEVEGWRKVYRIDLEEVDWHGGASANGR